MINVVSGGRDIAGAKAALRGEAGNRRKALFAAHGNDGAQRVARMGLRFLDLAAPGAVAAYHAVRSEFDAAPLLAVLARDGWVTGLPVVTAENAPLSFRTWRKGEALAPGAHGIPAPKAEARTFRPDVVLVPLLAFDARGYRLGYGGGFYDRTLSLLRKGGPAVAVGLAFAGQEVAAVPHDAYDQRLDWVLTEEGPRRCTD